jgi:hypothetical protein
MFTGTVEKFVEITSTIMDARRLNRGFQRFAPLWCALAA